jgi:single-strand DNA-binding protein
MFMAGVARLGRDIEIRQTANGNPVASLSLAYEFGQRDNEGKRATQWVDATLWGEQAIRLQAHLTRGTVLTVSLRDVRIEQFTRRDGAPGTKLAATVQALEFTPRQREKDSGGSAPAAPRAAKAAAKPEARTAIQSNDDFDSDIPF